MSRQSLKRYLCLLVAIGLLAIGCKGTPGAKDSDLANSISEPVVVIPEEDESPTDQNIDDEVQGDLAEGDLSEENADGELADAGDEGVEPEPVAVTPEPLPTPPPAPSRLEPATTPVEVPTAPTTTPPAVTAVTTPEATTDNASESTEEQPATKEETPPVSRWQQARPPVLEPPALRPQLIPDEEPVFSRVVRVTVGQLLEVPFRGTGWVYMGEMENRKGIAFGSRRTEPEGQNFVFRVEAPGTYALKFYKEDFIRDIIFNDYVQVIAAEDPEATGNAPWLSPPTGDRNRVIAEPRWPSTLEEAEIARLGGRRPTSKPEVSAIPGGGSRPATSGTANSGAAGTSPAAGAPLTSGTSSPAASNIDKATPPSSGRTPPANTGTANGSSTRPPANGAANGTANGATNGTRPPANTTPGGTPPATPPPVSPALPAVTDEGVSPVKPPAISGGADNGLELSDADWPPEVFLQRAQEAFDTGKIAEAIALLNRMRELYPLGNDELYWLLGQFYEANSPSRDILLSLDYYRRLIKEFPQSRRYNDARKRIAYLERYYINIQ